MWPAFRKFAVSTEDTDYDLCMNLLHLLNLF